MSDFFGKGAKNSQTATMNKMMGMAQDQVDMFGEERDAAKQQAAASREDFANFEFTNPYADAQNVYAGAKNTFAGAKNTFAGMDNAYAGLDNKYEGMENRFEDMTVDMRAADFQAQQGRQQRADIMQGLRGAAGSSGVGGLAQSLANAGAMQSQQIAAGIGQQERQNAMMTAQEGSRIDQLQRGAGMQLQQLEAGGTMANQQMAAQGAMQQQNMQMSGAMQQQQMQMAGAAAQQDMILGGDAAVQAAQFGQQSTLLGMDYANLAGANAGYQSALTNQMSGMGMKADMYGSQSQNNMFNNILSAGGQAAGAYFGAKSDRRLKKNINKIGESPSGLNIYSFEYINSKDGKGLWQGVMSDEIPPKAVILMDNGYDAVNYNMLDVEFKQI